MAKRSILLASSSPRRHGLLGEAGIRHEVVEPHVDEVRDPGEEPSAFALRCARAKAEVVGAAHPRRFVLAADTVVCLGDEILGKPGTPEAAAETLRRLSGKTHEVLTAVVLLHRAGDFRRESVVSSTVSFRRLTDAEIEYYAASGEGLDKAGAYGIQGQGRELVASFTGSLTNIVGLPMEIVRELLGEAERRKG